MLIRFDYVKAQFVLAGINLYLETNGRVVPTQGVGRDKLLQLAEHLLQRQHKPFKKSMRGMREAAASLSEQLASVDVLHQITQQRQH